MDNEINYENIHINSLNECLLVIHNTFSKDNKLSSIKLTKAKKYFEKYLGDFNPEQVLSIFKNPLIKGFTGDFSSRALNYAVKHNMVFPIMFANWFDNVDFTTLKKYLIILNNNNHEEQIKLFCSKDNDLKVVHYCLENHMKPSESLMNEALKIDSRIILHNSLWSKEKIDSWFNEHQQDFFFIVKKAELMKAKDIPENVNITILNRLADIFIAEEEKNYTSEDCTFIKYFRYFPLEYSKIIEKKSPNLLEKILSNVVQFEGYSLNVAQYFLESQLYHENGYQNILNITDKYSHLLTCPVTENIHMYKAEVDVFELALRKNNWSLFTPFSSNMDLLTYEQKEKMMVAAFAYISLEFDSSGKKILDIWAKNVFLNIDNDIFTKYYSDYKLQKKALHANRKTALKYSNHSLHFELEAISFEKKLDDKLVSKNKNKSLKI